MYFIGLLQNYTTDTLNIRITRLSKKSKFTKTIKMYGRLVVLLCAISFASAKVMHNSCEPPPTHTVMHSVHLEEGNFTTELDHFRPQNGKTIQFVS